MNLARANVGLWQCNWCQTKNNTSQSSQGERCLVCSHFKFSPIWSEVVKDEQSETIRQSYLSADFIGIANAIGSADITFSNSRYERNALEIALSSQLDSVEVYFCPRDEETGIRPSIGWVWPEANFIGGAILYREIDARRQRCKIERSSHDKHKSVNLTFEKSFDATGVSLDFRFYYGKSNRVESRSRLIKYETDGRY